MARYPMSFLCGMALLHSMPLLPQVRVVGFLSITAMLLAWLRKWIRCRFLQHRLLLVVFVLAGFIWAWIHAVDRLDDQLEDSIHGVRQTIQGCIASLPRKREYGWQFDFAPQDPILPRRVRLALYSKEMRPAAGDCWKFEVKLRVPRGSRNPGLGNYATRLFREGIGATGYVVRDPANRQLVSQSCCVLARLRAHVVTTVESIANNAVGESHMAIIRGLVVGDRSLLSAEQKRIFADTGTGHLMAISGLHVGLAMWLGYLPGYWSWWLWPRKRGLIAGRSVALWAGFLCAVCYAAASGFAIPTRRALIMLAVYMYARLSSRNISPIAGLLIAALLINLLDPFAMLAPGFWMSFCAVAAIFTGMRGVTGRMRRFASVQVHIFIGLMPVSAMLFGKLVLFAPLVNALAVPYASMLVIPGALIGAAAGLIVPQLGGIVIELTVFALQIGWPVLSGAARLPYLAPAIASNWVLAALVFVSVLLLLRLRFPQRWLIGPLCTAIVAAHASHMSDGEVRLDLLDVGQGMAAVVRTRDYVLVYDTGPAWRGGFDSGALIVAPFLNHQGYTQADILAISHSDLDHSGGAMSLLRRIQIPHVIAGDFDGFTDHTRLPSRAIACRAGQHWVWNHVTFEVLHPLDPEAGDSGSSSGIQAGNNASCVIRISTGNHAILLPGDIEARGESALLHSGVLLSANVVVVPHHGSATSSTPAFVRATGARYALVANGWNNRWGFPKPEIVARWANQGSLVHTTGRDGSLSAVITGDGILRGPIGPQQMRRYWLAGDVNH